MFCCSVRQHPGAVAAVEASAGLCRCCSACFQSPRRLNKYLQVLGSQYLWVILLLHSLQKKSCPVFQTILGPGCRIKRHHSPRESCSHALQKKKKLRRIPGIVILLLLEIFCSFCNRKAIRANLHYLFMCYVYVFPTHGFYCTTSRKILE